MKKVLLIGGNKGLGKAVHDNFKMLRVDYTVKTLSRSTTTPALDLTWSERKIKESVKVAISELGGLDILIVSSGHGAYFGPLVVDMEVQKMFQTNVFGPMSVFKACQKALLKSKGKACFVTSTAARRPGSGGLSVYASSKGAMHSWIISEGRRQAKKGIAMFAFAPGFFDSPMTVDINPIVKEKVEAAIPFKRFGNTEELSKYLLHLLFQSNWVLAGQIIEAAGGA